MKILFGLGVSFELHIVWVMIISVRDGLLSILIVRVGLFKVRVGLFIIRVAQSKGWVTYYKGLVT